MKKCIDNRYSFSLLTICYIFLTCLIKVYELILAISSDAVIKDFAGLIYGNVIAALFVSCCIFLIYLLMSMISNKIAIYISATLFSLMSMSEIGLVTYHRITGLLLGSELINRPLWEMVHTVKGAVNIWIALLAISLVISLILLLIRISKKKISVFWSKIIIALMLISMPLTFLLKPNQDKNVVNKIWYCMHSCLSDKFGNNGNNYYGLSRVEFDENIIEKHRKLYSDRDVIDNHYPLERRDNTPNVLGSYFKKTDTKPNIVFIIVESLGTDFFRHSEYGYTITPFLDSLSRHSLVWTNCLSTTARSAGVLPAVTASVPHGPKGFQFGDIPECNSLITILKENGYRTSAFYAGSFKFDRVSDYLLSQNVDYMSPFYLECTKEKSKNNFDYTNWGYQDAKMFERSSEVIKERDADKPNLDILITISQHDNKFVLNNNKTLENYYYEKAESLLQSLPVDESQKIRRRKGFIAAFLYSDDALRKFFYSYIKQHDNTIFIITGDHSLNSYSSNPLSAYHVPLIIWSPFIETPQQFQSVVSHNDIAPSLNALLRDNFNVTTPKNVHWLNDGLDTCQSFRSKVKTYFITQTNISTKLVYDDLYYSEEGDEKKLYKIENDLNVQPLDDLKLMDMMSERTEIIQYIDRYTYTNNRLTKNPMNPNKKYKLINSVSIDSAFCSSRKEKPSVSGVEITKLHYEDITPGFSQVKVVLTADMKYTADVHHHDFMNMSIKCSNAEWSSEVMSKNIVETNYGPEEWLKVEMSKNFNLNDIEKNTLVDIYMSSPRYDSRWNPEHSVLLKNINIMILGVDANNQ